MKVLEEGNLTNEHPCCLTYHVGRLRACEHECYALNLGCYSDWLGTGIGVACCWILSNNVRGRNHMGIIFRYAKLPVQSMLEYPTI
jgi:hypothetical protein